MFFAKMARNTKKKLAIFAGTSKCLIYAEAKYCASEMPGEIKYYECSRTEYCCAFGCCVSPGLHFHHLWYYWILVIIMFLVCSGGGWWYRYWLQGRYRAAASAIPSRSSNSRSQNSLRGPSCRGQRARITYNSARNTVLLQRNIMWKGPQRNGSTTPAYNNGSATTSTHYQNMSVVLNDANCPFYQLYGPPPSYETVIAQSRGKISNPASPESSSARSNNLHAANSSLPQCFSYTCNPSTRLNNGLDQQSSQYQNGNGSPGQADNHDDIPYPHYSPYCVGNRTIRQNICIPFEYQEHSFAPGEDLNRVYRGNMPGYLAQHSIDKSSDTSDPENQSFELAHRERYAMSSVECTAGSSREENPWEPNDRSISRVHGQADKACRQERRQQNKQETPEEISSLFSSLPEETTTNDSKSSVTSFEDFEPEFSRERRVYGGSLKAAGRYASKLKYEEYSVQRAFSKSSPRSCDGMINSDRAIVSESASGNASPVESVAAATSPFQSNPSNNVILESFVSDYDASTGNNLVDNEERRSCLTNASTNSDHESKTRLDRSKSLD